MNTLEQVQRFFTGWKFPSLMLSTLFFFTLLLFSVLLLPPPEGRLSQFANDFRVWCFGYDPATGQVEWAYVVMFLMQPLLIALVILAVWWRPLREMIEAGVMAVAPYVGGGLLIVVLAAAGLSLVVDKDTSATTPGEKLPFPAEQLRTAIPVKDFRLVDQEGDILRLSQFRNRVVMLTAVYARCGATCPLILEQTRRALAQLSETEKQHLTVLAITLDPAHDTPETLRHHLRRLGFTTPPFHFLTGSPPEVEAVLDRLGFSREVDPETGVIRHANLFLLIDKQGRLAYRFSLGEQQERWLTQALKLLITEEI